MNSTEKPLAEVSEYIKKLKQAALTDIRELISEVPELFLEPITSSLNKIYDQSQKYYIEFRRRDLARFEDKKQLVYENLTKAIFLLTLLWEKQPHQLSEIWTKHISAIPESVTKLINDLTQVEFNWVTLLDILQESPIYEVKIVLDNFARIGNINGFVMLLSHFDNLTPNYETYDNADAQVKKFLDYRPGKKFMTVYEYAQKDDKERQIANLFFDYENTSDEDSSEAMDEEFEINEQDEQFLEQKKSLARQTEKRVNKYATEIHSGGIVATAEEKYNREIEKVCYLVFRGEHYRSRDFSIKKIRDHYRSKKSGQPVIHDQLLETTKIPRKIAYSDAELQQLESLYHKRIGDYQNQFEQHLLSKDKLVEYHVSKQSDGKGDSPFISYSIMLKKAMMYAANYKRGLNTKREPHYRQTTGRPKHPNSGYVNVFLLTARDFYELFTSVAEKLAYAKSIKVDFYRENEMEMVQMLYLPGGFHIQRITITFLNLSSELLNKIDMAELWSKDNDKKNNILNKILYARIKAINDKFEKRLHLELYKKTLNDTQVILYPHVDGTVQVDIPSLRKYSKVDGNIKRSFNPKYDNPFEHVTQESMSYEEPVFSFSVVVLFRDIFKAELYKNDDMLLHGALHHVRTSIYTIVLYNLFESMKIIEKCYDEDHRNFLDVPQLKILPALALFHDIGRKKDTGKDEWEKNSAEICQKWLQSYLRLSLDEAVYYSNLIIHRMDNNGNLASDILHDADMLDVIRDCHNGIFYYQKLFLYKHFLSLTMPVNLIFELIHEIIRLIDSHGDIHQVRKSDNHIVVKEGRERGEGQIICFTTAVSNSNNQERRGSYNGIDCYEKVLSELPSYPTINKYYFFNTKKTHELNDPINQDPKRPRVTDPSDNPDIDVGLVARELKN